MTGFIRRHHDTSAPISNKRSRQHPQSGADRRRKAEAQVLFGVGEAVRVKDGPFTDFAPWAIVEDVNYEIEATRCRS